MPDLSADDKVGIVFCVVISLLQFESRDIVLNKGKVDVDQYISILYIFEQILCYRQKEQNRFHSIMYQNGIHYLS